MSNLYEVEVFIDVEPSRIWTALTEPAEINRWFGWDAETLEEEIRMIFVDSATVDPGAMRLTFEGLGGQYIEVEASLGSSVIRVVQPGEGDDQSAAMKEGWIAFFHQLKRYIEDHPGIDRRTVYLAGSGDSAEVSAALTVRVPGEEWYDGDHTLVIGTPDFGPGLAALTSAEGFASPETGKLTLTISTWGLSAEEISALSAEWFSWWSALTEDPEVVTAGA